MAKALSNNDYFQVFGHISVFFATLDFFVTATIIRLVDRRRFDLSHKINSRTTLQQKFRLIDELRPEHVIDPILLVELKKLLPTALVMGEKRNRYIHDQWMFPPDNVSSGKIIRLEVTILDINTGVFDIKQHEHTLDDLYAFRDELGNMQDQFNSVYSRLPA